MKKKIEVKTFFLKKFIQDQWVKLLKFNEYNLWCERRAHAQIDIDGKTSAIIFLTEWQSKRKVSILSFFFRIFSILLFSSFAKLISTLSACTHTHFSFYVGSEFPVSISLSVCLIHKEHEVGIHKHICQRTVILENAYKTSKAMEFCVFFSQSEEE